MPESGARSTRRIPLAVSEIRILLSDYGQPACICNKSGYPRDSGTTIGCGFVFRALVTPANGSFVPSIPLVRLFVFNEIGSFVPPKNFLAVTSAFSSSNMLSLPYKW